MVQAWSANQQYSISYLSLSSQDIQVWLVVPLWMGNGKNTWSPWKSTSSRTQCNNSLISEIALRYKSLTLYRCENSITTGAEREAGVGLMVTDKTLELRTVLFLEGERKTSVVSVSVFVTCNMLMFSRYNVYHVQVQVRLMGMSVLQVFDHKPKYWTH